MSAIVIELPNRALGSASGVGLWGRVLIPAAAVPQDQGGARDGWVQVDRLGRPSQANFLLAGEVQAAYRAGLPAQDCDRYLGAYAHALEHVGGYTPKQAEAVARTMLPEILAYDYSRPVEYPHTGRGLTDDVIDVFLGVAMNGRVKTDQVGPHGDLLSEFPFLGAPHNM